MLTAAAGRSARLAATSGAFAVRVGALGRASESRQGRRRQRNRSRWSETTPRTRVSIAHSCSA
jgi:hypothetical protein